MLPKNNKQVDKLYQSDTICFLLCENLFYIMILNSSPANAATLGGVGTVQSFNIKATAKSFSILSSGLYANKIRAIIRELSCNAYDSHVAAGKTNVPFEVHLPTTLEPHFHVRDFGLGLSHDQVINIFTTFFESTKTNSNDFVGALGLGSKSPFSYTDNFTVIAIKDGRRGVYTAFINEDGIPSIAQMTEDNTDEPNGVEVKFAVTDRGDFTRFVSEAVTVYTHFETLPNFTGERCDIREKSYKWRDIIPGVHQRIDSQRSIAIMGNIAYPIDVPASSLEGKYHNLLRTGLEIHFAIGELDFQASREGLSYIDLTVDSIKKKLDALNDALYVQIEKKFDAITEHWKLILEIKNFWRDNLFGESAKKYVTDKKVNIGDEPAHLSYGYFEPIFNAHEDILKSKYNLALRMFTKSRSENTCKKIDIYTRIEYPSGSSSTPVRHSYHKIPVSLSTFFVKNDTKIGASERAKFHWRNNQKTNHRDTVVVMEPVDRTKPVLFDEFLKSVMSPPADQVMFASTLDQRQRAGGVGKNISLLKLEERPSRSRWSNEVDLVWAGADFSEMDKKQTYYYVPLTGYSPIFAYSKCSSVPDFIANLRAIKLKEFGVEVYGVRKGDLEAVKLHKNWVNLEEYVAKTIHKYETELINGICKNYVENTVFWKILSAAPSSYSGDSPIIQLFEKYRKINTNVVARNNAIFRDFIPTIGDKIQKAIDEITKVCSNMEERYPLLKHLDGYRAGTHGGATAINEYITMVDKLKGV